MKNILTGILVIIILVVALLLLKGKNKAVEPTYIPNTEEEVVMNSNQSTTNNNSPATTSSEYKNDQLGFSFSYPKNIGDAELNVISGDKGKAIAGRVCDNDTEFCVFIEGSTPDFSYPGELNANNVSSYPTSAKLKQLSEDGYRNETKINSKGEEYVLIYGRKTMDMPYILENQIVAIFKLKSSADFKALGFMLVAGDASTFLTIMDGVDIY